MTLPGSPGGGCGEGSIPYTLITPNVLRVGSEEKIVVEAHGLSGNVEVTITVKDFPLEKTTFFNVQTRLNSENGMMGTALIRIPAHVMKKDSKQNQYVLVQAQGSSPSFTLKKAILVSFHSGYIFIQTDKTIYTPGSTGTAFPSCPSAQPFIIYPSSLGTWKVVGTYEDAPQQTFITQFDVKEYVLPSFEVTLDPSEKFFYIDGDEDLQIDITARFLFGKEVNGHAFVLFGVMVVDEKKSIPQSLKRVEITGGKGKAILTKAMLRDRFVTLRDLIGYDIYVTVTVLTDTGSDMVQAERTGISIVTSPYQIHFTKTAKYYKPGMPFKFMVYVTNPDGSPANAVSVKVSSSQETARIRADGTADLFVNTFPDTSELPITVTQQGLPDDRQAKRTMVAKAYQTQGSSGNYLHLDVPAMELQSGGTFHVNFNTKVGKSQSVVIRYFTYIILNKGKIVRVGRQTKSPGQDLVTLSLTVTPDLIPSFRIVAYYQTGNREIVADAVWVDVKDTCMGTLIVSGEKNDGFLPGSAMEMKLEGDSGAWVALVAVDKAVYVLNKKYKITQAKIWDTVEKNDVGCTPGSGQNNVGVFADAGLALTTNINIATPQRSDPSCPQPARRKRRSAQLIEYKASKAAQFHDKHLKKCCEDGMHENPMGHSCEKRVRYILETDECKNAFLDCCNHIKTIRDERTREETLVLARSDAEDDYLSDDDITSRSHFPESWLWQMEQLTGQPNKAGLSSKTLPVTLPDSITTWEVLAVSFSDTKGICVADPYEIPVRQDFFIDLRLPYSVVRNEQVEIRAVLYNYAKTEITVRVELMHNPAFCSAASSTVKYRQTLTIRERSSRAVPFVIVPLKLGLQEIEVKAAVRGQFVSDGVKKKLKVVGVFGPTKDIALTLLPLSLFPVFLDWVQEVRVRSANINNIIPDTRPETTVTIQGNPMAEIIENSINADKLGHLIITPSGCGEQNMMRMTAPVIATHYLDSSGHLEKVGVDRRVEAITAIMTGFTQQLAHRNDNASFAMYKGRIGSTWLTAYVVKVFAIASKLAPIDRHVLCGAIKWLILDKQNPDGSFHEDAPVQSAALGGYKGAESDQTLTAFLLVALQESKEICKNHISSLSDSINKATDYLARKYQSLSRPFTVALASYALASVGRLTREERLMSASRGRNRWEWPGDHTITIEATSYALLTLLKLNKYELSVPVARWLIEQKFYGGTYGQTQATVMVFQALAEYETKRPPQEDLQLDVSVLLPRRQRSSTYVFKKDNIMLARMEKYNEDFTVKANGTGQGTLTVVTVYNAKPRDEASQCKNFALNVSVEGTSSDQDAIKITICTRYLGETDATMSILDISMLTGFMPDVEDLRRLSEGVDRYISKFEINKAVSDRGNLIIYLDKVSHTEEDCLTFRAHKHFEVGLIQPASVTIYTYYSLDNRCTKFYHPSKVGGLLSKLCQGDVCRCAEGKGYSRFPSTTQSLGVGKLLRHCDPWRLSIVVYKTKLVAVEESTSYDNYVMDILQVIKMGKNISGSATSFPAAKSHESHVDSLLGRVSSSFTYLVGQNTWIEKWPNEEECQEEQFQRLCEDFEEFSSDMSMFGCPN
uniref:Anaphylatoxin-like domain-containing protein n=1 Tax=Sphenodon punctatus TaxID=8508 RepID=A0A8D0GSR7_SPHPU